MMGLFSLMFGSDNSRNLKKLRKIADKVVELEEEYKNKTNEELKAKTEELKDRVQNKGESLNSVLPEAFANVREAAARVLNMRHFYVQILGGIALHQGRIAEMGTGEGKTLVSTLPAYLNALSGKGVHVVTVNEYLAERDASWMGKVHKFLGLTVGVSLSGMEYAEKKKAYDCDITYLTNNEAGFDYLRDNMVVKKEDRVARGYNFAIVDEVDSILIDEARTPLIISGRGMKSSQVYTSANSFAKSLKDEDYEIDLKTKAINLTETGIEKAEKFFNVENISDVENIELNHHINNALKANYVMIKDENYIVKDGEILIVDEFTGRIMKGRRYSDGLHQAIEAKEGVEIKDENKTLATITFQNFFRLYSKLSGMTGTAKTEEGEFNTIYNLDVVQIPPNKPNIRFDATDLIYKSISAKNKAIVEYIKNVHETGAPILIGTINIDKSEELSSALKAAGIKHNVLNAKNHELESEIVAQAGRKNTVTIATNMAGRGTDILLGGNPEFMAIKKLREEGFSEEQISFATSFIDSNNEDLIKAREEFNKFYAEFKKTTDAEKEEVINLGGLHIVGTERHESRRIDNQLRGRAGRQGDPGSSVFYISLEDDLAKRFGGDRLLKIANFFKVEDDMPMQFKMLSKQIENAQKRIELRHFSARKNVLQFDDVLNKQRAIIYNERNKVLDGEDSHEQIMQMYPELISEVVLKCVNPDKPSQDWDLDELNAELEKKSLFPHGTNIVTKQFVKDLDVEDFEEKLLEEIEKRYAEKVADAESLGANFADFERYVLLRVVDSLWMDHIDQMTVLRNEIGLQGYGQHDPIVEYKRIGFDMFDEMISKIREQTALFLLNINVEKKPEPKQVAKPIIVVEQKTARAESKTGRNSLCPCGSGKKYKNCCGKK
ncbi:MAG: preprotein translocase subunit SecA [Clostridia bacterium]|nr:preprotein translocase subunit SecA [Clostridia bacterium]